MAEGFLGITYIVFLRRGSLALMWNSMTMLMFLNKERPLHSNLIAKMGMARDEPREDKSEAIYFLKGE